MKTTTTWRSGQSYESNYRNSKVDIDGNAGFSPKALLLTALAACSGIDVVIILEKMRVPFADLQIDAETEQTDTEPKVFKDIYLVYRITTEEYNMVKIKKAVDLSLEKYCGVAAMLKKHSAIHYKIIITEHH